MGEIRARVRLENLGDRGAFEAGRLAEDDIRVQDLEAIVDTGAMMTLLPQDLVEALGLKIFGKAVVSLADETRIELPTAGTLTLTVAGRTMHMDCLVGPPGCEPLIGQLVMEQLDLIADPGRRTLTVRPESPYLPTLKLKSQRVALKSQES
ncbi:MAG: aspartyl protease family protein [Elusimicrobia bacterium]|nr:aspartyl protease family protein [Elusimicrobiota bacterium]